jgi:hypothetical protein
MVPSLRAKYGSSARRAVPMKGIQYQLIILRLYNFFEMCEEYNRLLDAYVYAATAHSAALALIRDVKNDPPDSDSTRLNAEQARTDLNRAKFALEKHAAGHACQTRT